MTEGTHYTDIEQGSPEWHALRCGKVTASRVADILRKTKTGPSASRQRYAGELVAERLTGIVPERFKNGDMQWGNDTEPLALASYCFYGSADVALVAFVDHPTIEKSGASPDGLVGDAGLVEIKCPATHTHIQTLLGAPIDPDYAIQMQWQMACTGRAWCDFVSFDPRMPEDMQLFTARVQRDDAIIKSLEASVLAFTADIDATVAMLLKQYRSAAP
jgi:putative phage-type endonuclease